MEAMDDNNDNENSNDSNSSSTDDKTYHFRKGSDLDGFESLSALYADGLFTDLAICCADRVFRCHRVVMAASSAYIKNALSAFNGTEQNNCNTIMILPQEIKVQDMEAILHFIYNGQVEVTRDAIESFLSSAKVLHIKGLANIKLVYNNSNNQNNSKNKNIKNPNNNSVNKSVNNNENQNNQNNNNYNNCNNNNNENNNTNSNSVINNNNNNNQRNNSSKRRNGIIGGQSQTQTPNRSPKLKTDLNFNSFVENIPQNQSFHSSQTQQIPQELDSKPIQTTPRRKQKICAKPLPTNGLANSTNSANSTHSTHDKSKETTNTNGDTNNWITIEDEEEAQDLANHTREDTPALKVEEPNDVEKSGAEAQVNGTEDSGPAMPCLIQIDADPTTFPTFCSEANGAKNAKRRRSSSAVRLDAKNQKSGSNSLVKVNRNSDSVKQMVRSSNRKLGFISFHKKAPTIWNSGNKWKCEICNKLYGNKQTLKEHMDYFHSNRAEQIFTCSICAKEYTWKKSLMKHYRDIHQISNTTSLSMMRQSSHRPNNDNNDTNNTDNDNDTENDNTGDNMSEGMALDLVTTESQDNSSQSK